MIEGEGQAMQLYKAQYIYPVSSPPIIEGVLAIDGERISAVGPAEEVMQQYPGAQVTDLGRVLLLPQAVNAHTHLELTTLAALEAPGVLQRAQEQVRQWRSEYGEERVRFGVTLHTPFTVSAELFRITLPWVIEEQVPFCIHIAESPAEAEYLLYGTGEIADTLFPATVPITEWISPPGCSPISYLNRLGVLAARPLLAHGVRVERADLRLLAEQGIPMAHCPRSNFLLNCGRMPLEAYQEAEVLVAMGTDSLSSSPSLSVWEEGVSAMETHRAAGVKLDPHDLLRMCTLDGACALGFDTILGSLEAGKLARLAVGTISEMKEGEVNRVHTADEVLQWLWDGAVTVKKAW